MSVGEFNFPDMPVIPGVELNAVAAGIKKNKSLDLVLLSFPENTRVSGVFTQNAFCAAPVTLCRQHLQATENIRGFIINSGNANACTGEQGMNDALETCALAANLLQVSPSQVLPFSTGVIGEPLPLDRIKSALADLIKGKAEPQWPLAAQGIMTTDTQAKAVSRTIEINGEQIIINGIAKGAGMICPNMATMLAYLVSNANVSEACLQKLVKTAADKSFNRISIDGDTSTNDSFMLAATCQATYIIDDPESEAFQLLQAALIDAAQVLAQSIVKDGEGATKFLTIQVEQGRDERECLAVAYAIAHSPLVKTALFASDPNWGRIVCAIGYADVQNLVAKDVKIYLDDVLIVEDGGRAHSYQEAAGQAVMNQAEINLRVCLGRGQVAESIWTTDLSHEYVTINAEYRT